MMWVLLFILMLHLEAISGKNTQESTQPDHMMSYLQARDKCTFKTPESLKEGCGVDVGTCEVEATLPEGSGYYIFTRIGPFTSTGGTQRIYCKGSLYGFGAPAGTLMTRAMAIPVEPYTGMLLSFPPIHLHHAHIYDGGYLPQIPHDMKEHMPWIMKGFTAAASSEECMHAVGGVGCFNVVLPAGHALKRYENETDGEYEVFMEDIRKMGSPPMSTAMEFGTFILTKPNPAVPPSKHVVIAKFGIGDYGTYGTYEVPYNTENYQVGTFHIAFKMEMAPYKIHIHGSEGDEMWTIRGTQEDLGVPEHLRSPVSTSKTSPGGQIIRNHPINMGKDESLEMWKARFEESMSKAGAAWESRTKRTTMESWKQKKSSNSGSQSSYFVAYNENDPRPMLNKPEILCKYYSLVEHVTPQWIASDKAEFQRMLAEGGHQYLTSEDAPYSRLQKRSEPFPTFKPNHDPIGPDGYVVPGKVSEEKPTSKIVSKQEQYRNLFEGVLPGMYYRHPRSALLEKERKYTQCDSVVFDAGDYFTIIGLNAKRKNPEFDSAEFYGEPLKNQHTLFQAILHLPDVPWFH